MAPTRDSLGPAFLTSQGARRVAPLRRWLSTTRSSVYTSSSGARCGSGPLLHATAAQASTICRQRIEGRPRAAVSVIVGELADPPRREQPLVELLQGPGAAR